MVPSNSEGSFIIISGNFTGGVTPVPIPNTEVKPTEVDGTVVTWPWESRTLPVYLNEPQTYGARRATLSLPGEFIP